MAPLFSTQDLSGRCVALDAYRGRQVLLSFNRAAACPFCSVRTYHLIQRAPLYQRMGLNLIAFFESSPERAHSYLDQLRAPYPVIVDTTRDLYGAYGLETSPFALLWAMIARVPVLRAARRLDLSAGASLMELSGKVDGAFSRLPGDFLIGPDGRIQLARYGRDAGDFLLFRDLETAAFGAPLDV